MKTRKILKSILALAVALPLGATAQVDINREKYPDYNDKVNPDWSLIENAKMQKSALRGNEARNQRPAYVNNAELKYFPPVFNQDGGSCGSASRISYMFTYELNAYRDLDGKNPANYYPSHFVWLLTNGNSGKNEFVTSVGVPSAATYGGQTYSSLFGNQDCADNDFGWMQGYDKWFEAMHNRMLDPVNFPLHVGTEEGRELVKNWLWNHNGDNSFKAGGVCGIGVASVDGNYEAKIPSTSTNNSIGVAGKKFVKAWGPQVDHALTIVGYDDRIEFDLDGNGVAGEKEKDEVGAWIIVNSWGTWWGNNGFIYCPYAYAGPAFNSDGTFPGNWWQPEIYKVRKDYRPLRTIKLEMDYSRRSEIKLSAGVSADINATAPEKVIDFEHFKYAGDGNYGNSNPAPEIPMLGRWADGKLHTEPMEFGYDLTDLTAGYDRSMPLKYFFIVETRGWAKGTGNIYNASIMDYEFDLNGIETPFILPEGQMEIKNAGNKTIISVVVYGEPYYAPQNISLNGMTLNWEAPLPSTNKIEKYRIYHNGIQIAEVPATSFSYTLPAETVMEGGFGISTLYEDAVESEKRNVMVPVVFEENNVALNLKKSGLRIPDIFDNKYENATIEFYIKPNSLVDWNQSAGPGWNSFMMHSSAAGEWVAGWDTNNRVTTSAGKLNVGTWTHVAVVVQGNRTTVYINGQNRGVIDSSTYSGIGGFGDLVFSADLGSYNNAYTDASIDEIRIWKKARKVIEVRNGYKVQFSGSTMPEGLIAYYKGDLVEVDGKTMLKEYISGNHAEILNPNYEVTASSVSLGKSATTLTASINAINGDVYAGIPVNLSATYSDAVASLLWTIEDAGVKNAAVIMPTVTFKNAGEQKITLVAKGHDGQSVTSELTVNVLPEKPVDATFRASKNFVAMGDKVSFIVENPAFGQMYEWTIPGGEEKKIYGMHASTVFRDTGKQSVTLKVTSLTGANSATSTIDIDVLESAPVSDFEVNPTVIIKGEKTFLKDISKYHPTEWKWTVENPAKKYVINGQNSSITPEASGIYSITLDVANSVGKHSVTRQRALIVCNADSKNGLNFTGRDNAKVTANTNGFSGQSNEITVDWWMRPDELRTYCLGLGDKESTFMIKTADDGLMYVSANNNTGKSSNGYVKEGEWHHYAVKLGDGFVDFYRDGVYHSTSYMSYNAYIPSLDRFTIGSDNAKMNGQIDELRVWNRALSNDEIYEFSNQPIENPTEYSYLVLYYDFNQSGGDVMDRSMYGNNGVRSGFGPDGDAWGLSRGVFSINAKGSGSGDVTSDYLSNYRASFSMEKNTFVNTSVRNRFYALTGWTIENAPVSGSVTTGAHVDAQKSYCMTFTTIWDGFGTLSNHKVYQTVTLPAGKYTFTAKYHNNWEGQCGDSYVVVDEGKGLPNTASINSALAYTKMTEKGSATENSVEFYLEEETEVSLGLLVNMSDKICMTIESFVLERDNTEYIEADGEIVTSIECITDVTEQTGDNAVYDLQGRKVLHPAKGGIYIKNGKKFFVK